MSNNALVPGAEDEFLIAPEQQEEFLRQHTVAETELIVGLVGAVGTDLPRVCKEIGLQLDRFGYKTTEVGLSALLHELEWDAALIDEPADEHIATHMDAGDQLRERWERADALALLAISKVIGLREQHREEAERLERRAYVLRSLKTPKEAETLRRVYGSRFVLIGVHAPNDEREQLLTTRIAHDRGTEKHERWEHTPEELMGRDESEGGAFGQNVRDTFHRADLFVDAGADGDLAEDLYRCFRILFGDPFATPTKDEFGVFQATGAAGLSAEPGRQVGAALATAKGEIIALGTNEVPRPGGGFYFTDDDSREIADKREFQFRAEEKPKVDTNNVIQRQIAREIVAALDGVIETELDADELLKRIMSTRLGALTEFGRAVHAEMAAILDAARNGHAIRGATLYATTFPCHTCARHLIGAGVMRAVYIAPYAKSLAAELHAGDLVVDQSAPPDGIVHFQPFVGVAPRRYMELFAGVTRKHDDGRLVEWDPETAKPRLADGEPDEMRQNRPGYRVREQLVSRLVLDLHKTTGLGMKM
jgi:deoxycytidylate deaminase